MINLLISEFRLQSRHWSWGLSVLLSFMFGLFVINRQTPDMDIQIAGAYFLVKTFTIELLILPVMVSLFAAQANVRDFEQKMASLVYASSINLKQVLASRLIILIVLCWLVYLSFAVGITAGLADNEHFSLPLVASTLFWCLTVILLPVLIFVSCITFAIGLYTQRSLHLYLFAGLLFFAYQLFLALSGSPIMATRATPDPSQTFWYSWLDPYGISAYFEQVKSWLPEQKNQQLPGLSGILAGNRLAVLVLAVCVGLIAILNHIKHFKIDTTLAPSRFGTLLKAFTSRIGKQLPTPEFKFLPPSRLLSVAKMEWQLSFKTKTFALMSLGLTIITASEIHFGYIHLESMGTTAVASTLITINRYISDVLPRFGGFFVVILAAELCWRDRQSAFKGLIDSTPVTNTQLFSGRFLALCFVPIFFITLSIAISIVMQLFNGGTPDIGVYAQLYIYLGLPLLWLAAMCIVVHALLPNKYIALALSMLIFFLTESNLLMSAGLEHPFWTLGKIPSLTYSDVAGFGAQLDGFRGYMLLRVSLILLACLVAFKYFRRGEELSQKFGMGLGLTTQEKLLATTFGVTLVFAIFNISIQTWYEGNYQSSADRQQWKADYEQKFATFKDLPTLKAANIQTTVELDPQQGSYLIKANYTLENRSSKVIDKLMFSTPASLGYSDIEVENATLSLFDEVHQTHIYQFKNPLNPGDKAQLSFTAFYQQNGYQPVPSDSYLSDNFSYIRFLRYLPWFGYQPHYQLSNNSVRSEFGLQPIAASTLEEDIAKHNGDMSAHYDWATLDTTIITTPGQKAFAAGELIKFSQQDDKWVYHYKTHSPVRNIAYVISSTMEKVAVMEDGINIEIYFPEGTNKYAKLHQQAIRDTLSYANKNFGQINSRDLRLIAAPATFPSTGYALPQAIFIGEEVGFHVNLNNTDGFDHLYRRTAHEVAHQWWGHGLNGANTEGEGVLVETLAKYTEMVLLEQKYGVEYVKRLIKHEQNRYFHGSARSSSNELPLYRGDDNHLIYSKGSAAMYTLRHVLGEKSVNDALKKLIKLHSFPLKPATTLDLIRYLSEDKTARQLATIDSWFKQTDIHDLTFGEVSLNQTTQGYLLQACVIDNKAAMPDTEITLFNEHGKSIKNLQVLPNMGNKNKVCTNATLREAPVKLVIDAQLYILDSDRDNNQFTLAQEK